MKKISEIKTTFEFITVKTNKKQSNKDEKIIHHKKTLEKIE